MNEQTIDILSKTHLFSGWDKKSLEMIVENSGVDNYKKDEVIFEEDKTGDRFYLILEGNVVIRSPEDKTVIAEFISGEIFGETAIITGECQKAIASAAKDSTILSFPKDGKPMEEVLSANLSIYAHILKSFLVTVAKRTRKANSLVKENSPIIQELQKQVYGDKLTGLLNRAYLEENIGKFMQSEFALLMIKPDNFKSINDGFGHEKGDECLIFIGNYLSRFLDRTSVLIRYQGSEFAVIAPEHSKHEVSMLAKKIKDELEYLDISPVIKEKLPLRISLGVLFYPETKLPPQEFIKKCAEMPLASRARGGSQILFAGDL